MVCYLIQSHHVLLLQQWNTKYETLKTGNGTTKINFANVNQTPSLIKTLLQVSFPKWISNTLLHIIFVLTTTHFLSCSFSKSSL